MKRARPEGQFQEYVVAYLARRAPDAFVFAIPNGGGRSITEAIAFKREGVKAGVADLCILAPDGRTIFWELKDPAKKNPKPDPAQLGFKYELERRGIAYELVADPDMLPALISYYSLDARLPGRPKLEGMQL